MSDLEIISVNTARPSVLVKWPTKDVLSAIDKRPVAADALDLGLINLEGDEQADTRPVKLGGTVHGGPDQAVYAFPAEHYPRFETALGRALPPGFVGENLTIRGALETDTFIGDVWAWGEALLQVTSPRGPCFKLGIRMGSHAMRRWVREEGLVGWYLRVLRPGRVPTRGRIEIVTRDPARVTVLEIHRALEAPRVAPAHLLDLEPLAEKIRNWLRLSERDLVGGIPEKD